MGKSVGRSIHKLSATEVSKSKAPGYLGDGGGLWLQVAPAGTKSWIFRFTMNGRAREMGLGPLHTISLADAREKAAECRRLVLDGVDPIEARAARKATDRAAVARVLTFDQCAERYIEDNRAGWRKGGKSGDQWQSTLDTYASPVFGKLPVGEVDLPLVLKVLKPIWTTKTETAKRVRGRIESVLAWATVHGYRTGDNPARWRGHLDKLLPPPEKVSKVEHHPALPYARIGEFMAQLRAEQGTAARAVEFIILTACRTSEAFNAKTAEFDLAAGVWTVPADRTKAEREHRVPLSKPALALVKAAAVDKAGHVFPGARDGKPLSNMAGLQLLKRMGFGEFTVHGFRSTFRDWAREQTNFPREVAEAALAHVIGDKTEAAYARGDMLEKRAALMKAWADYCAKPLTPAGVIDMKTRAAR